MIVFPNAKINIGLDIIRKRSDGYHELETLFFPLRLRDALEFVENYSDRVNLTCSGIPMDIKAEENIILKAYRILSSAVKLPGIDIHLHKAIPYGAGLGGGSSDAAFLLSALNEYFELKLSKDKLKSFAIMLGADCAFFLENKPALASGIGEILEKIDINLQGYFLLLVKPPFGVVTREAYARVIPDLPKYSLIESVRKRPEEWSSYVKNDFEIPIFNSYPEIKNIKVKLLEKGALYASMSGSGSSVFGIFKSDPNIKAEEFGSGFFTWNEWL